MKRVVGSKKPLPRIAVGTLYHHTWILGLFWEAPVLVRTRTALDHQLDRTPRAELSWAAAGKNSGQAACVMSEIVSHT